MYLIGSIGFYPQSAVTLYIYRVGKTYPTRNPIYRSKSIKNSNYSRIPPRPVRPVDANFGCQHMPPCFLVKLACQKIFFRTKIV